jgi:hypothetical protein
VSTTSVVVTAALAVLLAVSATLSLVRFPPVVENIAKLDLPESLLTVIGIAKALAAVGLVVGLAVPAVGVAAAAGTVLFFLLAVGAHLRARDWNVVPPLVLGTVALVALVLLSNSVAPAGIA